MEVCGQCHTPVTLPPRKWPPRTRLDGCRMPCLYQDSILAHQFPENCVCVCVCVSDLWRCSSSWMIPFGQPYLGSLLPASHHTNLNSVSKQFVWGLWWTKWHWDRSSSKYFDFPLSPFCYSLNTYSFTCHKYCVV